MSATPASGEIPVVNLDLAAGAHAQAALDAGVEIDAHRGMAGIALPALSGRKTTFRHLDLFGPMPEFRIGIMRRGARRLIRDQKLHHHFLGRDGAGTRRLHLHANARRPLAGGGQHALAFDFDHADAAIAVGAIIRRRRIAQVRNFAALTFRDLPDRLARIGLDLFAVELELNFGHSAASFGENSSGKYLITLVNGFDAAWPRPQIDASRIA